MRVHTFLFLRNTFPSYRMTFPGTTFKNKIMKRRFRASALPPRSFPFFLLINRNTPHRRSDVQKRFDALGMNLASLMKRHVLCTKLYMVIIPNFVISLIIFSKNILPSIYHNPWKNELIFQVKKWGFDSKTCPMLASSKVFLGSNTHFLMGDTHLYSLWFIFKTLLKGTSKKNGHFERKMGISHKTGGLWKSKYLKKTHLYNQNHQFFSGYVSGHWVL